MNKNQIIDQGIAERWGKNRVKAAAFESGISSEVSEILAAIRLVNPAGPSITPAKQSTEKPPIQPCEPLSPTALPTPTKLEDGAIIFVDAAGTKYRGKHDGGCQAAVVSETASGRFIAKFLNYRCFSEKTGLYDSFMAEAWAVLKGIEIAKSHGLSRCTIKSDAINGFGPISRKRNYKGNTYMWLAEKIARESGIQVAFDRIAGNENMADPASRS